MDQEEIIYLKNQCFEITEHLIENDTDSIIRKKIVRTLAFKNLLQNMIKVYNEFKVVYNGKYNMKNENALGYGFQIFLLMRDLDETNKMLIDYSKSLQDKMSKEEQKLQKQKKKNLFQKTKNKIRKKNTTSQQQNDDDDDDDDDEDSDPLNTENMALNNKNNP